MLVLQEFVVGTKRLKIPFSYCRRCWDNRTVGSVHVRIPRARGTIPFRLDNMLTFIQMSGAVLMETKKEMKVPK